jgi:hypothetical protein
MSSRNLPRNVWIQILPQLNGRNLARLEAVSQTVRRIINENYNLQRRISYARNLRLLNMNGLRRARMNWREAVRRGEMTRNNAQRYINRINAEMARRR